MIEEAMVHIDWRDLARDLTLLAAAGAAVWFLGGKWVWNKLTAWKVKNQELRKTINETIPHLVEVHIDMDKTLAFIVSELTPNHGTSLKDAVNRIEKMVAHNAALQRGIMSQDAKAMFIIDAEGNLIWCNAAYLELTNKDSSEVMGKGFWGTINPGELDEVRKQQVAAVADKRDMLIYHNIATGDPDFPLIPVESNATPILDKDGELEGYVGSLKRLDDHYNTHTDIGRMEETLNRVESQVEKNEALIRGWWSQEEVPMWMNDVLGNCVWVNNAMVEMCEMDSHQLMGRGWMSIIAPEDKERVRQEIEDAAPDKRESVTYYSLIPGSLGAKSFRVKATAIPIFDKNNNVTGYIGTLRRIEHNKDN